MRQTDSLERCFLSEKWEKTWGCTHQATCAASHTLSAYAMRKGASIPPFDRNILYTNYFRFAKLHPRPIIIEIHCTEHSQLIQVHMRYAIAGSLWRVAFWLMTKRTRGGQAYVKEMSFSADGRNLFVTEVLPKIVMCKIRQEIIKFGVHHFFKKRSQRAQISAMILRHGHRSRAAAIVVFTQGDPFHSPIFVEEVTPYSLERLCRSIELFLNMGPDKANSFLLSPVCQFGSFYLIISHLRSVTKYRTIIFGQGNYPTKSWSQQLFRWQRICVGRAKSYCGWRFAAFQQPR